MKFCGNCGSKQPDDAVTCENCGAPLSSPPTAQQPVQHQWQQTMEKNPSNPSDKKKAIASLVLGIIGVVFGVILGWTGALGIVGLVVSIVGVYLAVKARNAIPVNGDGRGMATAGWVCGIIGIVFGGIIAACVLCAAGSVGCTSCAGASAASRNYWDNVYYTIIMFSLH